MKAEETFEFDQGAYAAKVSNYPSQRLQEQEIVKTRQIIKNSASITHDTITAVATAGATLLMPIYSARQYDIAKKKLAIIQTELTKRGIPLHKPDNADNNAAMLGFVAGEVAGDAMGNALPVSMPDDSLGSVMVDTAGGEWGDSMAEKATERHEAKKAAGPNSSSRLQAYPLPTQPPLGANPNHSSGSQAYPSNIVPSSIPAVLAPTTQPAPSELRIPYGPNDYPPKPSTNAYRPSHSTPAAGPPPYPGYSQPNAGLGHGMQDEAASIRDIEKSLSATSLNGRSANSLPSDSKTQMPAPATARKPAPPAPGIHAGPHGSPIPPGPSEQAGLIPTSTINPPPYPGYSQSAGDQNKGAFPPNSASIQLPLTDPSSRTIPPPQPQQALPQRQHPGKSHRLQCNACGTFFDGAFTQYLYCSLDNFLMCSLCMSRNVPHTPGHQMHLMQSEPPHVHTSTRSSYLGDLKCKACAYPLKNTQFYSCMNCMDAYRVCFGCYAKGFACQHGGDSLRRTAIKSSWYY